jgi:hypothetical protein
MNLRRTISYSDLIKATKPLEYNLNGFNKTGIHKNGTSFDNSAFDMYGFDIEGKDKTGNYYNDLEEDYLGFKRLYIQRFLAELREFLNIPYQLNVFCVVKFNYDLNKYLNSREIEFSDLIKEKLKNNTIKLNKKMIQTFNNIFEFKLQ